MAQRNGSGHGLVPHARWQTKLVVKVSEAKNLQAMDL